MWKRYRFKSMSVEDYRPLIFNPKYPWWCTGHGSDEERDYVTIVAYLPVGEDVYTYWDDAYDLTSTDEESITFTDRFSKPDYFVES